MRILYLNPSGNLGGAETSLLELLASVRNAAPDWELFLILPDDGRLAVLARELGVQVVVTPFPPAMARLGDMGKRLMPALISLLKATPGTILYRRRLIRAIASIQPDIIHSNGFKMHLLGAWIRPRRTPLVWHIHDYVGQRPLMRRLLLLLSGRCTRAIVNSKSVAEDLRAVAPELKIQPIYNAVNLERFSPYGTRLDLDALAGLTPAPPGVIRVGLAATFARWKGHKVFLEALANLSNTPPVRGYVIGGPIYQTLDSQWSMLELQQEASRLNLDGKVGFTGFVEDIPAAMRSLDIVIHASTTPEPFGMVIVEAMACAKAVIASHAGGACELFVQGENALSHPPGDARALAQQMTTLICDESLRLRLGWAGRAAAEQLYHGQRLGAELLGVYQRLSGDVKEFPVNPTLLEQARRLASSTSQSKR